jgi:hypothetical protein
MAKLNPKPAAEPGEDREYEVVSPVDHDGVHYVVGAPIVLGEPVAAPLLKVGAIK